MVISIASKQLQMIDWIFIAYWLFDIKSFTFVIALDVDFVLSVFRVFGVYLGF